MIIARKAVSYSLPSESNATIATSFFLGVIFSLFPYDYPLLWSSAPISESHLDNLETHLKLLHNSPNLIVRIMHIITFLGLLGLVLKLYRPSESNMLFDGGSLVLYVIALIIYITNIVKGLRIVSEGVYGVGIKNMDIDQLDDMDSAGYDADSGSSVLGREDNLKVLAASNTILALVLVGIIVLQVGQWYAERAEERERKRSGQAEQERQKKGKSSGADAADGPVTRSTSNKKKQ
jgi:hypothetical protein